MAGPRAAEAYGHVGKVEKGQILDEVCRLTGYSMLHGARASWRPSGRITCSRMDSLSAAQWREDLRVLATQISARHRNPFHYAPKDVFNDAVAALHERIPDLRGYEVVVGLHHIAAVIGDGHTRVETSGVYQRFPLELYLFEHTPRVTRTVPSYARALGTRLVKIGAHDVEVVLDRLARLIPQAENELFVSHGSARLAVCAEPLAALGLVSDVGPAPFTFETDDGTGFVLELEPVPPDARLDWLHVSTGTPLHLLRPEDALSSFYLAETQTVYANFRRYDCLGERSRLLWECVDNNPVNRLVIDMRHNGGGNYVEGRFHLVLQAQARESVNRAGRLFVITGRATFSAAMTNATDFRRETEALLVGEPPGARPNGYQELFRFTLPNSNLQACCAIRRYRFQDVDAPSLRLDKRIDPEWQSFRGGQDPVLDWILEQSPSVVEDVP